MLQELKKLKPRQTIPGFVGRFLHSNKMTFAYWEIAGGASSPEHAHVHEQAAFLIEGEFELTVDGVANHMTPGTIVIIPSNVRHSGRAIIDCKLLDVFDPVREDYK
jgi:quercetin dioxygenase-like cupin family protein